MKHKVEICVGTACFVQGGADLLTYNEFLDEEVLSKCTIDGTNCFDECKKCQGEHKPPFVSIDGKIYGEMHREKLSRTLREIINARD